MATVEVSGQKKDPVIPLGSGIGCGDLTHMSVLGIGSL